MPVNNIIHLHYLNPFFEVVRKLGKQDPAAGFGRLFTYKNLRAPETDSCFSAVVASSRQDTLRGYMGQICKVLLQGGVGRDILLVHQPDYMGPYALMLWALLIRGPKVTVFGPQGLREEHGRRELIKIVVRGVAYWVNRLRAKTRNLNRLEKIGPIDCLKLKRPYPRSEHVSPPRVALIEPTNQCNLGCPVCETGNKSLRREKASMTLEQFQHIVAKLPKSVREICLHINGESFLNKAIYRMIRHGVQRGFKIYLDTNGLLMDPSQVVASGLDQITICLDGDSPQSYAKYRINGNYHRLVQNIKGLVTARKSAGVKKPHIILKAIAMRHTQGLVDKMDQVTAEMGADDFLIAQFTARTCDQALEFQSERSEFSKYLPTELKNGRLVTRYVPNVYECQVPYYAVSITAAGDVDPCCRDMQGEHTLGNLLRNDFEAIWNGPLAADFRRKLIAVKPNICQDCHLAINPTIF